MKRIWLGYTATAETLCILGIVLVSVLGGLQVWFRYVMGSSLIWSEELMRFTMIWVVMTGAGLAYSRKQFMGMRFFVNALPPAFARACDVLSALLMLGFLGAIGWYGWLFAWKTRLQLSTTLGFSLLWLNIAMVVGAALLAIHIIRDDLLGLGSPATGEDAE